MPTNLPTILSVLVFDMMVLSFRFLIFVEKNATAASGRVFEKVFLFLGYSVIVFFMGMKKRKQINPGRVIIPGDHPNPPLPHEVDAALVLVRHYHTNVEFIIPVDDYKRKTADFEMLGVQWEIKSPVGASKSTIGTQFRRATMQSRNIVLDTRRTKLKYEVIEKQVALEAKQRTNINRIILINKSGKIVEIKK